MDLVVNDGVIMHFQGNSHLDIGFALDLLVDGDVYHFDGEAFKSIRGFLCKRKDTSSLPLPVSIVSELN